MQNIVVRNLLGTIVTKGVIENIFSETELASNVTFSVRCFLKDESFVRILWNLLTSTEAIVLVVKSLLN